MDDDLFGSLRGNAPETRAGLRRDIRADLITELRGLLEFLAVLEGYLLLRVFRNFHHGLHVKDLHRHVLGIEIHDDVLVLGAIVLAESRGQRRLDHFEDLTFIETFFFGDFG